MGEPLEGSLPPKPPLRRVGGGIRGAVGERLRRGEDGGQGKEGGFRGTLLLAQDFARVPRAPATGTPPTCLLGGVSCAGRVVWTVCWRQCAARWERGQVSAEACRGNGRVRWRPPGSPPLHARTHLSLFFLSALSLTVFALGPFSSKNFQLPFKHMYEALNVIK